MPSPTPANRAAGAAVLLAALLLAGSAVPASARLGGDNDRRMGFSTPKYTLSTAQTECAGPSYIIALPPSGDASVCWG